MLFYSDKAKELFLTQSKQSFKEKLGKQFKQKTIISKW